MPDTPITPAQTDELAKLADDFVLRISEWDDRTSPEDWPEALLITPGELRCELIAFAREAHAEHTGPNTAPDALAKLAEIPAVGSEERERWLEDAKRRGVEPWRPGGLSWPISEEEVLTLMSEARKQGQRDVLGAGTATKAPTRDIGIAGPVHGMNEPDPSGSYMRVILTKHEIREERLSSFGAAEVFVAEALGLLHGPAALSTTLTEPEIRDDIACHCNGPFGPNSECGACGGSGCVSGPAALATGGARHG